MTEAYLRNAMDAYGPTVYRLALCRLQNTADAEDVYQEVFLRLWKQDAEDWEGERLKAWLIRTALNRCADLHRFRLRRPVLAIGVLLAAAIAGLFGILAMLGLVIWYLCTIDSDGVAYMAPFVDSERPALWRTLLRRPQPDNKFRPPEYGSENRRRQR